MIPWVTAPHRFVDRRPIISRRRLVLVPALVPAIAWWLATFTPHALAGGSATEPTNVAEAALLDLAGPAFRLHRTPHFVICHDGERSKAVDLGVRLEATYAAVYRFCKIIDFDAVEPQQRLEVLFFGDRDDFLRYAETVGFSPGGSSGFFQQRRNRAAFFDSLSEPGLAGMVASVIQLENRLRATAGRRDGARQRDQGRKLQRMRGLRDREIERVNRLVVQHEGAHQVLFNAGVHVFGAAAPTWLVEGVACLFETPPGRTGAGISAVNQLRLADVRDALRQGRGDVGLQPEDLARAYRAGAFVPLARLVRDRSLFVDRDKPEIVYRYAQSWSLVDYLFRRRRAEFGAYLRMLAGRQPGVPTKPERELAEFEQVFGAIDAEFERRWIAFVIDLPFRPAEAGR